MSRPPCTGIAYRYLVRHPAVRPAAYLSIAVVRTDLVRHPTVRPAAYLSIAVVRTDLVRHPAVRPAAYLSIAVVRTDLVRHSAVSVFDVGMWKVTVFKTVRVAANVLVR